MTRQETIQSMKLFLFDLDGTLYLGDRLFPFTIDLLRRIRETGSGLEIPTPTTEELL